MTGLIAGAILLIVASAAALIFGWIGSNETLIWISIAGSVGAAVCLALAYYRSKQETSRPRRGPRPDTTKTPPATATTGAATAAAATGSAGASVSQDTQAIDAVDVDGAQVVADGSGKFHRPGCPQAKGSGEKIGRDEAKGRGLEACRVCRP